VLLFPILSMLPFLLRAQVKFIPNKGQWDTQIRYKGSVQNGNIFVLNNSVRYNFLDSATVENFHRHPYWDKYPVKGHAIFVSWLNANAQPAFTATQPSIEYYNFFQGNDQSKWRSGLHGYSKLYASSFYPKIDMELYGLNNGLKYNYIVQPGGSAAQIQMQIEGADKISIVNGELHILTSVNEMMEAKPYAYQEVKGQTVPVSCTFTMQGNIVSFRFPKGYNDKLPLVIDPTLIFATYSGATEDNWGFTGTFDSLGHGYSGGTIYGTGLPAKAGAYYDSTFNGGTTVNLTIGDIARDCAIYKYSKNGDSMLYATYLGGNGNEQPHSMVVNSKAQLIVFGTTSSTNFPVSSSAYNTAANGKEDMFLTTFAEDGKSIVASSYIGGSGDDGYNGYIPNRSVKNTSLLAYNYGDIARGEVIVDHSDNVYVASVSYSSDFPTSSGAYQTSVGGHTDGVAFKMNSSLSSLIWSTYVGDTGYDAAYSIQLDKSNNAYVCGGTESNFFFKDTGAYQQKFNGNLADGFVCEIKNDGTKVLHGTFLGTAAYDQCYFVQLDNSGYVYVYGQTASSTFPVKNAAYSNSKSGQFITKFNSSLSSIQYSTVFGTGSGKPDISPTAFLVDKCERVYISGWGGLVNSPSEGGHGGSTKNMPITKNATQSKTDGSDFYVALFERNIDTLLYSSYFGGPVSEEHVDGGTSRFDKNGIIYQSVCGGCGRHSDFPVTANAWSKLNRSYNCNNLLFKVDVSVPSITADFISPTYNCKGVTVGFKNNSQHAKSYLWMFGDGDTSSKAVPVHTYKDTGKFIVTLVAYNPNTCQQEDTLKKSIYVYTHASASFVSRQDTCSYQVHFTKTGASMNVRWLFGDSTSIDTTTSPLHIYKKYGTYKVKMISDSGTTCEDSVIKYITVKHPQAKFTDSLDTCSHTVYLKNQSQFTKSYIWTEGAKVLSKAKDTALVLSVGTHKILLTAKDSTGCSDTTSRIVTVISTAPSDSQLIVPTFNCIGNLVSFNTKNTHSKKFRWFFGDGDTSNLSAPQHHYASSGKYIVKVILSPYGCNGLDTLKDTINVYIKAKATFRVDRNACSPVYQFIQTGFSNTTAWDFGDGNSAKGATVSHIFFKPGKYRIRAVADSGTSCVDTFSILINTLPVSADFTYTTDTCNTYRYHFRTHTGGMGVTFHWQFPYAITDTSSNPYFIFRETGPHTVTLVAKDTFGCTDTMTKTLPVVDKPVAKFTSKPVVCTRTVNFINQSISASTHSWDFGDGQTDTATNPSHTFPNEATYTVRLIVNNKTTCADTFFKKINVTAHPIAHFSYHIDTCTRRVTFKDTSETLAGRKWLLSDTAANDTGATIVHTYKADSVYPVTLVINTNSSCPDTARQLVAIALPKAQFVYKMDTCTGKITFVNNSKLAGSYLWKFGDNTTDTSKTPSHNFTKEGTYKITLIINPGTQCTDSTGISVTVKKPFTSFTYTVDTCRRHVTFINTSYHGGNIRWYFGDGSSDTSKSLIHTYIKDSVYTVSLVTNIGTACKDSITKNVVVNVPRAAFTYVIDTCTGRVTFSNRSFRGSHQDWNFGDGSPDTYDTSAFHIYPYKGDYTVTLRINPGTKCEDIATMQVHTIRNYAIEVTAPNVFSPNGDGINDFFDINGLSNCLNYHIYVYDRWGVMVFSSIGHSTLRWDGLSSHTHNPVPEGVYYYVVKAPGFKDLVGSVTVVR
jgi:gliding motility-associated-like protein